MPGFTLATAMSALAVVAFGHGVPGPSARPLGGIPTTTTCKPFTGPRWVNPYPPHEAGHHFQVSVTGRAFTCASAGAYVRKFTAEKIKASPKLFGNLGYVRGAPAGYVCTSGIGYTGTAYQGNCRAKHATLASSSFTWGPYNDS